MPSLLQAIERQPLLTTRTGPAVRVRDLVATFAPDRRDSVRSLITRMLAGTTARCNWAVILCRFKNGPTSPAIEAFFRQAFAPGTGGLVEYWADASLGTVDISGSRVFGWVELDITRTQAGGMRRTALVQKAVEAAERAGLDVKGGFFSQIAVFTNDWSRDNLTAAQMTDANRYQFWIDGSSDTRTVSAPPHGHSGSFLAHEMAHVHGFKHDYASDLATAYGDPYCLMSAMGVRAFTPPNFSAPFGPTLCLPHLVLKDWAYAGRIRRDDGSWRSLPGGLTFDLAEVGDLGADASLGVILPTGVPLLPGAPTPAWDYYLEFGRRLGWNAGYPASRLLIRRMLASAEGLTSALLANVELPTQVGATAEVTETSGATRFRIERTDEAGRTVRVTATKL